MIRIKRGKHSWLYYDSPAGTCRILAFREGSLDVTETPETALAKARELWPNEEILCDEPASEGFYGE